MILHEIELPVKDNHLADKLKTYYPHIFLLFIDISAAPAKSISQELK